MFSNAVNNVVDVRRCKGRDRDRKLRVWLWQWPGWWWDDKKIARVCLNIFLWYVILYANCKYDNYNLRSRVTFQILKRVTVCVPTRSIIKLTFHAFHVTCLAFRVTFRFCVPLRSTTFPHVPLRSGIYPIRAVPSAAWNILMSSRCRIAMYLGVIHSFGNCIYNKYCWPLQNPLKMRFG